MDKALRNGSGSSFPSDIAAVVESVLMLGCSTSTFLLTSTGMDDPDGPMLPITAEKGADTDILKLAGLIFTRACFIIAASTCCFRFSPFPFDIPSSPTFAANNDPCSQEFKGQYEMAPSLGNKMGRIHTDCNLVIFCFSEILNWLPFLKVTKPAAERSSSLVCSKGMAKPLLTPSSRASFSTFFLKNTIYKFEHIMMTGVYAPCSVSFPKYGVHVIIILI